MLDRLLSARVPAAIIAGVISLFQTEDRHGGHPADVNDPLEPIWRQWGSSGIMPE